MDTLVRFLDSGLLDASWWQVLVFTLAMTHITIAAVTIFLHRAQAHRALELGPVPSHFFRFWLWLTTGMVTKEWVSIHRKHHAKCETTEDPHSPIMRGIKTVLLTGSELYRAEAKVQETLDKYGHNTPDDWIEHHLYSRFIWHGVGVMLIIDFLLFGAIGVTVWAVQMLWIPITAAGIINGIGHYSGYRNFEVPDASTNIVPWGILIGGEELHNNHHTYPTSAKLSVKPWEFDIGWLYIRALESLGQATVRRASLPSQLVLGEAKALVDKQVLEAVIANRYEVMAIYAQALKQAVIAELNRLRREGAENSMRWVNMNLAKVWLHRDEDKIPHGVKPQLEKVVAEAPNLAKLVSMREELRQLWIKKSASADQLVSDLQAWCRKAEESGIATLEWFSLVLRAIR